MIYVVSGPGGAGKGTVVEELLRLVSDLTLSRSWTTRARRPGEPEDAYVFATEADFLDNVEAGGFLEWTRFAGSGSLYGTPVPDPDLKGDLLLEIELDGAQQVKNRFPEAVLILLVAPSVDVQEQRLRGRGDTEQAVQRRIEVGLAEEALGRKIADHVVVNDDMYRAAAEVAGIIEAYRSTD